MLHIIALFRLFSTLQVARQVRLFMNDSERICIGIIQLCQPTEAEWVDIDDVDMGGLDLSQANMNTNGTPVIADRQVVWDEDSEVC